MNRKMLVISFIVLFALSVGFAGGRVGFAEQPQGQNQTKPQSETSDMSVTDASVARESPLAPVGTGFTYQGRLSQAGSPSSGSFDFVFTLYDSLAGVNQVGNPSMITLTNQTVTGGLFTVQLDFGPSAFFGDARWLQLAVRQTGAGAYTTLSPRQPLTPAPYAQSTAWQGTSGKPFPYNPLRAANATSTLDSTGDSGQYTSITIGADGLGLISYNDENTGELKVAHCSNVACTSSTNSILDSAGAFGKHNSITLGADGLGLISYHDDTNDTLKVAHCSNANCTAFTISTLEVVGDTHTHSSITIGADGLGLISYHDENTGDLKVAHCSNIACTSASSETLDSAGDVGESVSITIGADGLGLISYRDITNTSLKVAKCGSVFCLPYFHRR